MPGNLIDAIIEDKEGRLWIATDKGLSRYDRKSGAFTNYGNRNGLAGLEFIQNIAVSVQNGNLYFGQNGIMYFNPDSIKDEYLTAPVVFTDLKIYNKSVPVTKDGILHRAITQTEKVYIPSSKDVITIDYALLDYFDVKKNTFRYKLEGFDMDWNNVGTRNSATYTNLPPGKYSFVVRATNNNGIKNEKEASLQIVIVPTFYQTQWFQILLAVTVVILIVLFYQIRTRSIVKRNKLLEHKVAERTMDLNKTIKELNGEIANKDKFFSIIAHDLRSPFIALLGFSKYLVDDLNVLNKDEIQTISENIFKSAKLTFGLLENLLQWARIKTGRINFEPEKVDLKKIIDETIELYKNNAQSKRISLDYKLDDADLVYADLNMVQTILRNLVSNSIKFTDEGGRVVISVNNEKKFVRVNIIDSGVGMDKEKITKLFQIDKNVSTPGTQKEQGSGLGLILCKEFVELNRGQINVKSKIGEGSEFSFTLPKYAA